MMRSRLRVPSGSLLAALLLAAPPAQALSDAERAGARAAASEGAAAFEAGRWTETIDRFRRAEAIVHSPVHLLFIARAQIKLGQLVEAREALIKIANEALPSDAPAAFHEAKQEAEQELTANEARIPYVTVSVSGEGAESAAVTMDGEPVPPTLIGVPRPVNPGKHRFRARAEGMASEEQVVTLGEGDRETVVLTLHPSEDAGVTVPAPDVPAEGQKMDPLRIGAFVGLGVGVVGLGLGTVFTVIAAGKRSDADDEYIANNCAPPAGCPADEARIRGMYDDADSAQAIGIVGFVVGALGVGTGVTLLVLSSKSQDTSSPGITPYAGLGHAGVIGRF
jgi:hypothetical protein